MEPQQLNPPHRAGGLHNDAPSTLGPSSDRECTRVAPREVAAGYPRRGVQRFWAVGGAKYVPQLGRHPAEGNTHRRSSAGSLGLPAFRRELADSLGVWLEAMGIVYLDMVCVRN